jgi:Barstar (barnase inhibitor)
MTKASSEAVQSFFGPHGEEEALRHAGDAKLIVFDGSRVDSHSDFVAAANAMLPLDPPLGEGLSWDAFSDSLWSGVDALREPRIAVLWQRADVLSRSAPAVFDAAIQCFREVAVLAQDPASGIDVPTSLTLLLVHGGDAP